MKEGTIRRKTSDDEHQMRVMLHGGEGCHEDAARVERDSGWRAQSHILGMRHGLFAARNRPEIGS